MKIPTWITATSTALAAIVLPACDAVNLPEIRPGISTQTEVAERMGKPSAVHWNDDGSATWEYNRQPAGSECHMITFDRDQKVQRVEQVLNDNNYARITPGLSKDDVRRILGAPGSKVVFRNLGEEVWEWRIAGMPPMEETYFNVHFSSENGAVKKTSKRVQPKG